MDQNPWVIYFTEMPTNSEYYGWVKTIEEVDIIKQSFEIATKCRFPISATKTANFGNTDLHQCPHFVRFQDPENENQSMPLLKYNGFPYLDLNKQLLECHRGFRVNRKVKNEDHFNEKKKRNRSSKKLQCPAKIHIREVAYFPDFGVVKDTVHGRRTSSKKLRMALKDKLEVTIQKRFYIFFPQPNDHVDHDPEDVKKRPCSIHKRLKRKISEFVLEGVVSLFEMKRLLKQYVMSEKNNWFGDGNPPETRRFFPTDKAIRNCINSSVAKYRDHHLDQEKLKKQIEEWSRQNVGESFYFRPSVKLNDSTDDSLKFAQSFLFVHQTSNQKTLLARYGNEMCLLDATYRTTKFLLPLYFVCVKTNVNYQPIGCFITMNETSESIYEALVIIRDWNSSWLPKCFMTEFAEQEINAIERLFPNIPTYISDFYVEQSWQKWLKIKSHAVGNYVKEIMSQVKKIAEATTEAKFEEAVADLKATEAWCQSTLLQNYFSTVWYPNCRKWSRAFCTDALIVSTYSGIERLNGDLRHNFLNKSKENEISALIRILRNDFFPAKYEKYVNANMHCSFSGTSNKRIPEYLQNRPREMINYCLGQLENSKSVGLIQTIEGSAVFFVSSALEDLSDQHCVFLGSSDMQPHCDCEEWIKFKWPCKHVFAVLAVIENGWEVLPDFYKNSVFNILDETIDSIELSVETKTTEFFNCDIPCNITECVVADVPTELDMNSQCRNLLNSLIAMMYTMDQSLVTEFLVKLQKLHRWVDGQFSNCQVAEYICCSPKSKRHMEDMNNDAELPERKCFKT